MLDRGIDARDAGFAKAHRRAGFLFGSRDSHGLQPRRVCGCLVASGAR